MRTVALSTLAMLAGVALPAGAQLRVVAGQVTDERTGRRIGSGEVQVRATGYTDRLRPDGVFVVRMPQGGGELLVRSPGYRSRTVVVAVDAEVLFVELEPQVVHLSEVIVDGRGVGLAQRSSPPGVATVDGAELEAVSASTIDEALQGRVLGANIQRHSGTPGGGWSVRLRGVTSLQGARRPLYVVDGVIVSDVSIASGVTAVTNGQEDVATRLADLGPHDIEHVKVLRGAAATSQYGSLGAHGVVIITTRRGRRTSR